MKPLKLTMQAFGPYAGTEIIDFRQLENRTMFVISGKTGAGKTTIFDGISYAIYGKASGEDRNGPDLRSQFADDELLTEVSLEFSLRQKTYQITRSPQQEKKKKNGEGTTNVGAKAELYLVDENGELQLLASNVREVEEKIKEIMIIDSNQFRQILMIPQGEFRKLLTSDSKEKEIILQRLFHTEIYKRVEEKLKEEASELKKSVEDQVEKRNSALRSIKAVENEELTEFVEAGSVNDVLILPLLKNEIEAMGTRLEKMSSERHKLQQDRDKMQQRLFEAEATLKQIQSLDTLRTNKEKLDGQKDIFIEKEKAAELAKKAALLSSQEQLCHRLKADCDHLTDQLSQISKKITQLTEKLSHSELEHQKQVNLEPERKTAAENVSRLEHMKEDVQAFASIAASVEELKRSLKSAKQRREKNEADLKSAEERLKILQGEKEHAEKSQLSFLENDRKLEKLTAELDKLKKLGVLNNKTEQARASFEFKKGFYNQSLLRLKDAKAAVEELEQKWLHSQAAVLAASLQGGVACPVCGSDHHPNPAAASDGFIPSEEDLKAGREQASALEEEKSLAEKDFIESDATLNSLKDTVVELVDEIKNGRPDFNIEGLTDAVLQTESDIVKLQKMQDEHSLRLKALEKIKTEMKRFEEGKEKLQQQVKSLDEDYQSQMIQYTEKKTTLERMTEKIPEELRSLPVFEAKLKEAIQWQKQLDQQLEQARKNYQEAKEQLGTEKARGEEAEKRLKETDAKLTAEREEFKNNMNSQGFENYQLYHQAKKPERDIQLIETEIRNYREEVRSVTDRFAELSAILQDVKKPDMEGLQSEFAVVNDKIKMADEVYQDLNLKKRDNQSILEQVESLNEQMKVLEERYKLVGHLYEISKGQNTYRITFERFVLAAFLDDILAEANVRLNKMTSGRYRLLRKTDRSKGNVQSGLELLVLDAYTGQERHVKTLSGGESFKAALSLALGLADVVQNYAGGVSLETMFIDEGFGTLDPESLDQAIEALIDIQSSGRLVGIISHVPELKERIDARLEVIATQTGSKTEFLLMN
ncbi:SMC family ATPase [Mesobacillus subterraneus]|uniref:AAA family ATPase n=1 Tax=Mesobacillus subterraneus TaxID=285983 RepID=UPI00203C21A9|nr:SMC family ATPase [Mesobacillus subterraneus]MCM3664756.1 SMC family ATPase [Mesobacillus subterraneus]MCM3681845.1 SMC family ATPase [Mesobacillus subterraneus]